jgi:hypothetical protein
MITPKVGTIRWVILLAALPSLAAEDAAPAPYMGQEPPGFVPKVFTPGVICLPNRGEGNIGFTKDWRECYFDTSSSNQTHQIMVTRCENGHWTTPVQAPFSDNRSYGPSLADNDQSLYFIREKYTIWKVHRSPTGSGTEGWSQPEIMPAPVNLNPPDSQSNVSCHISSLGNMWICSWRPGGFGRCDLWRLRFSEGQFTEPTNQRDLNSNASDCTAVPGPNEEYVVLRSNRPGGFGNGDLYVSFADGKGGWTALMNLGATINTSDWEDVPSLSPDNKYLFFSRNTSGDSNIYWVSTQVIEAASIKAELPAGTAPLQTTK